MAGNKIEFYESITEKDHKAFWVRKGSAIEFGDRQNCGYPLNCNINKIGRNNVNNNLLNKISAAGINPTNGELRLARPSDYLKNNYKNVRKRAKKIVAKLLIDMEISIKKECKLPKDMKKEWPQLARAKYKWEFLRRSKKFHSACDDLLKRRDSDLFEDAWTSGSSAGLAGRFPNGLSVELNKFLFIWGVPFFLNPLSSLLFTCYKQDFRELLVNLSAMVLLQDESIDEKINRWGEVFAFHGINFVDGYRMYCSIEISGFKLCTIGNSPQLRYLKHTCSFD
jgi:hypothetical protein